MNNKTEIQIIPADRVFSNVHYIVPIYQRNYAWKEKEIVELIEDIYGAYLQNNRSYFLGNLIVNQTDNECYDVIDGQQRLTTLFLLQSYLKMDFSKDALRFEAREKSNRTLSALAENKSTDEILDELLSQELKEGFEVIKQHLETNKIEVDNLRQQLKYVNLIRIQVPPGIDLNHYFEIMNTRGEQLELHEIAKAKFLSVLRNEHDKKVAALIWEACSNMNHYVQMNVSKQVRDSIFSSDWSSLKRTVTDFDELAERITIENRERSTATLIAIIEQGSKYQGLEADREQETESERFESTINFPNFVLQVNAVMRGTGEKETTLDDKYFLANLEWAWSNAEKAKDFLFHLLKCRVLFDKYVLKREFVREYKDQGRWSLQQLKKYEDSGGPKPMYVSTFDETGEMSNKVNRTLQSCLRITYTSPKTMHWITVILKHMLENERLNLTAILEDYGRKKVIDSNYEQASGFDFERIVFTYLDYLLYRDGYHYNKKQVIKAKNDDFQFLFRTTIEHFFPQKSLEQESWERENLDGFGNLALISVASNAKLSNLPPSVKAKDDKLMKQSLKLLIMKHITTNRPEGWTVEHANEHKVEMFDILNRG